MNLDARRYADATQRNRQPILEVLQRILPDDGNILEIASGTGQHADFSEEHKHSRLRYYRVKEDRDLRDTNDG